MIGPALSGKSIGLNKLQETLNRLSIKAKSDPELGSFPMVE